MAMFFASRRVGSASRPLHVAVLASFAIAQPLFDVLGNAPEFLLAHDLGPAEILALTLILGIAVPAVFGLVALLLRSAHVGEALIALFSACIALLAVRNLPVSGWFEVAMAAAAGIGAAMSYRRSALVRTFVTWLAPGIVLFPILFVLRPGVYGLIWPEEKAVLRGERSTTPVILVVFDGLPLASLLDANRVIDRGLYPSFGSLASQSTWYRNATTVADYTRWAVPAIVSGRYPRPDALPTASDHPESIFTLLGGSHTVSVHEPISRLCPQSLCNHGGRGVVPQLMAFADTLSLTFLHAIAPGDLAARLPVVDLGWAEGVPPSENPGEVWMKAGEQSRPEAALAFIDAIQPEGPEPSFYFIHVLLPHVPLSYLPGGQRYGTERSLPGLLERRDRWENDEWAVTQGYRRYLLQIGAVDTLLGVLLDKLKQTNLYDRALLVVTSDHGASFKAGRAFRRVTDETFMDVLPVPLFVKEPDQRTGIISDRNVETIDILPTIADILKTEIPWSVDGASAYASAQKPQKTAYHDDARRLRRFGASLLDDVYEAVDDKLRLFGVDGNHDRTPANSPLRELIGTSIDELRISEDVDGLEFSLDLHGDFSNVDTQSGFLPAHVAGRARWRTSDPVVLAVAVNGVVRGTTRTYRFQDKGSPDTWSLVLPASAFRPGRNDLDVFVVQPSAVPVLHHAYFSHIRPINLLSNAAAYGLRVAYEGLYPREGEGERARTWTNGRGTIVVPANRRQLPRSLRIDLAAGGAVEKDLRIVVNSCEVFAGRLPTERRSRIFAIHECVKDGEEISIAVHSPAHPAANPSRPLGVPLGRVELLDYAWPPPATPLPELDRRSQIRFKNGSTDEAIVDTSKPLTITVINRGGAVWGTPHDLGGDHHAVRLGVLWFRGTDTDKPVAIQRVELPASLVPHDSIDVAFQLSPRDADGALLPRGEYEVRIGLLQEGVNWFYASGDSVRTLRVIHDPRP